MSPDARPPTGSAEQIRTFITAQMAVRAFCHAHGYNPDELGTASARRAADALTAILVELEDRGAVAAAIVASTGVGNSGMNLAHATTVDCLGEEEWATDPMDNTVLAEIIACGMVTGWATGIVARGTGADGQQTAYGWHVRDGAFVPLAAAETFAAYSTDSATGEPVPPPRGLEFEDACALDLPHPA
ncbi:hypothetical protein [Streptomyces aureoversilis]|uniref:Uncharacterized protein n=1 Tax=Streptomyces aureoversilis TaxID=67277 RepID=A0ABW0A694_9ACTN